MPGLWLGVYGWYCWLVQGCSVGERYSYGTSSGTVVCGELHNMNGWSIDGGQPSLGKGRIHCTFSRVWCPSKAILLFSCSGFQSKKRGESLKDITLWLGNWGGVRLLRLVQDAAMDHCVLVRGSRELVLDSANRYSFHSLVHLLRYYGGSAAKKLEFSEVMQLVP